MKVKLEMEIETRRIYCDFGCNFLCKSGDGWRNLCWFFDTRLKVDMSITDGAGKLKRCPKCLEFGMKFGEGGG